MNLALGIDSSSGHTNVAEGDGSIGPKTHLRFSDIKSNNNLEEKSFVYGLFFETIVMEVVKHASTIIYTCLFMLTIIVNTP